MCSQAYQKFGRRHGGTCTIYTCTMYIKLKTVSHLHVHVHVHVNCRLKVVTINDDIMDVHMYM